MDPDMVVGSGGMFGGMTVLFYLAHAVTAMPTTNAATRKRSL